VGAPSQGPAGAHGRAGDPPSTRPIATSSTPAPRTGRTAAGTAERAGRSSPSRTTDWKSGRSSCTARSAHHVPRDLAGGDLPERERRRQLEQAAARDLAGAREDELPLPRHPSRDRSDQSGEVYAGLEVDGVLRSRDRGEPGRTSGRSRPARAAYAPPRARSPATPRTRAMLDSHALTISSAQPGTVFLAVRWALPQRRSRQDLGGHGDQPLLAADLRARCQGVAHDPRTLWPRSAAARSKDGSLYRSDDLGQSGAASTTDQGREHDDGGVRCIRAIPIRSTASRGWARSSAPATAGRAGRSGDSPSR